MKISSKIRLGLATVICLVFGSGLALWLGVSRVARGIDVAAYAEGQRSDAQRLATAAHGWLRAIDDGADGSVHRGELDDALASLVAAAERADEYDDAFEHEHEDLPRALGLRTTMSELEGVLAASEGPSTSAARVRLENALFEVSAEIEREETEEAEETTAMARATLWHTVELSIGLGLLLAIGIVAAAVMLDRQVRRGILALERGTRQIAEEGVDAPLEVVGNDEFAQVMRRFNEMLLRLHDADRLVRASEVEARRMSRTAGMAEIAAGVLHNLGNSMTSVTTTSDRLGVLAATPRLGRLGQVAALLTEHERDLGAFLTDDPRGCTVLPYLSRLGAELIVLRDEMVRESGALRTMIDHSLSIIHASQQAARHSSDLSEPLQLAELVEFAKSVAMGGGREGPRFDYVGLDVRPGMGDRHRIAQILINLLSNAKHAVLDAPVSDPRIEVRAELRGADRIAIIVTDNGVGIAPEGASNLFRFGYTTKRTGNGFGLHVSANTAAEIGGRVIGSSAGLGQGARFELELPWTPVLPAERSPGPARAANDVALAAEVVRVGTC